MTKSRQEQIEAAAEKEKESAYRWHSTYDGNKSLYDYSYGVEVGFNKGAEWADEHLDSEMLENLYGGRIKSLATDNEFLAKELDRITGEWISTKDKLNIAVQALKEIIADEDGSDWYIVQDIAYEALAKIEGKK